MEAGSCGALCSPCCDRGYSQVVLKGQASYGGLALYPNAPQTSLFMQDEASWFKKWRRVCVVPCAAHAVIEVTAKLDWRVKRVGALSSGIPMQVVRVKSRILLVML